MKKVTIKGKEISVSDKRPDFWAAVEAGQWEPDTFDIIERFIKDKIFIDIGAWNGVCSLFAAALGAICHSVECDEVAFSELEENTDPNPNIKIYELAIGNVDGILNLKTQSNFGNSESSLVTREGTVNEIPVLSRTMLSFFHDIDVNPSDCLIKIDIEGGEVFLLKEAESFLRQYKPTIYISFHPAWFPKKDENIKEIIDIIFSIYKVKRMKDGVLFEYSAQEFRYAMEYGEHTFILTK